jgi:hypothetical protein
MTLLGRALAHSSVVVVGDACKLCRRERLLVSDAQDGLRRVDGRGRFHSGLQAALALGTDHQW